MDDRTVTGRVVAVLDAVADGTHPLTLAELTRAVGLPKPTVRRIAADLVSRDMLVRTPDGGYRLGQRLLELGLRAAEQRGIREVAAPYIQDLFARTGEVAWISLVTPTALTLIDIAFGRNRAEDVRRYGWPTDVRATGFLATAAGRVAVAVRPELAEPLRGRPLTRFTPATLTSWSRLDSALEVVRDTGIAIEHEQLIPGFSCIATHLRDRSGSLIGTVGVTARTNAFDLRRLTRVLDDATAGITRQLPPGGGADDSVIVER